MISIKKRCVYEPSSRSFAVLGKKNFTWLSCREQFHRSAGEEDFVFSCGSIYNLKATIAFMKEVEKRLKIEQKSVFEMTDMPSVLHIVPSKWWREQKIRFSLFTILLRCGQSYNGDNFATALGTDYLSSSTSYAVNRFLKGNTYFIGRNRMWYSAFYNKTEHYVDTMLVKPGIEDSEIPPEIIEQAETIVAQSGNNKTYLKRLIAQALKKKT